MITCDRVSIHRAVHGRNGGYNRIVVERRNIDENLARVFAVNAHSSVKKSSLSVRVSARARAWCSISHLFNLSNNLRFWPMRCISAIQITISCQKCDLACSSRTASAGTAIDPCDDAERHLQHPSICFYSPMRNAFLRFSNVVLS